MNPAAILTLAGLVGGFMWLATKADSVLNWGACICFASDSLSKLGHLLATGAQS